MCCTLSEYGSHLPLCNKSLHLFSLTVSEGTDAGGPHPGGSGPGFLLRLQWDASWGHSPLMVWVRLEDPLWRWLAHKLGMLGFARVSLRSLQPASPRASHPEAGRKGQRVSWPGPRVTHVAAAVFQATLIHGRGTSRGRGPSGVIVEPRRYCNGKCIFKIKV